VNKKKDSAAAVDISEIKNGEPVSLFIIQVAAPSWAATQVPEITLAIQSCLKTGFLRAVQVEHFVMIGNEGAVFCMFSSRTSFRRLHRL
jgi:hypothetical protein